MSVNNTLFESGVRRREVGGIAVNLASHSQTLQLPRQICHRDRNPQRQSLLSNLNFPSTCHSPNFNNFIHVTPSRRTGVGDEGELAVKFTLRPCYPPTPLPCDPATFQACVNCFFIHNPAKPLIMQVWL